MVEQTKGRVGRPPKSEAIIKERRARRGNTGGFRKKLDVPQNILDNAPDYVFRWVSDRAGRIQDMVSDGWELVDRNGTPVGDDAGSAITKVVGANEDTKGPMLGYLMRLPREFYEADKQDKEDFLRKRERGLIDGPSVESGYIPDGQVNRIGRG